MPISLPEYTFRTAEDIVSYAVRCYELLGLADWSFGFDRAARRLGRCCTGEKRITLSRYFVAVYLEIDPAEIHRTLLHEMAHALEWVHLRSSGHGKVWQQCCAELGIPDERATVPCADFSPRPYRPRAVKYVLCHAETGEVFCRYTRKPKRTARELKHYYIPGRKEETLGHLVVRKLSEPEPRE